MVLTLEGKQKKKIIVEGNTVKIIKGGGVFSTERIKTLPIPNITSVEIKKPGPFIAGFIQFSIAGGKAKDSTYKISGGAFDAAQDENSVVFNDDENYNKALKIKDYIENYADNKMTSNEKISNADEIRKYKQLADDGIISSEEYEKKKKELLNG